MIGISTCYLSEDVKDLKKIIDQILRMGFEAVELEYRISETQFKEAKSYLKKHIKVFSIHNYFPKPDEPYIKGSGDLYLLSSTDKDELSEAIKHTVRTIECANDLEAKAVVLHLGRVDMPNPFERLKELFEKGKINEEEGRSFIEEQRKIRRSKRQKNLDSVLKALDKLIPYAERYGVFLGIENRFYFHEIPDIEELRIIFKEFEGSNIRYWHDIGHAIVQEKLGICPSEMFLEEFSDKMIGIHIHDVRGIEDHLAPGEGEVRFDEIMKFVRKEVIKIFEIHKKAKEEEIIKAKEMFYERFL